MKKKNCQQAGFTLIECICAMAILLVAAFAIEFLTIAGLQTSARDYTTARLMAATKVEEFKISPPAAGGSLTVNQAGFFQISADNRFVLRWLVTGGPVGTRRVTVGVTANQPGVNLPVVQIHALVN